MSQKHPPALSLNDREFLRAGEVGVLLGVSVRWWAKAHAAEHVPAPMKLSHNVVGWRRRELLDWIDAGCPHRCEWKWRPTVRVKLERVLDGLKAQAVELAREIANLEARRVAGESAVNLGRARP